MFSMVTINIAIDKTNKQTNKLIRTERGGREGDVGSLIFQCERLPCQIQSHYCKCNSYVDKCRMILDSVMDAQEVGL